MEAEAASFKTEMLLMLSGLKNDKSGISTPSNKTRGLLFPLIEPVPRTLIEGEAPKSFVANVIVRPGTVPCNPLETSVIGLLLNVLPTSTEETAPVRLTFFCVPNPTTTTSYKVVALSSMTTLTLERPLTATFAVLKPM